MALKIVTGGTTGAADGTLVSSSNKIVFTALDTVVDAHIRADDDTYSADASFSMPSDGAVQVSYDGGSTWKAFANNPASYGVDIGDRNVAIKLRQHANATASTGTFQTDSTTPSASALADVTGFTVTPAAGAQMNLSWSAVTNRTAYRIDRATDSGFTTGVSLDISPGLTSTSVTDTGRTAGTTYYYRIKAVGTVRYADSASYATGNGLAFSSTLIREDTFVGTDGDLLASGGHATTGSLGSAGSWTKAYDTAQTQANIAIKGNKAIDTLSTGGPAGNTTECWLSASSNADCAVEADVYYNTVTDTAFTMIECRLSGAFASRSCYRVVLDDQGNLTLGKIVSGSFTSLGTGTITAPTAATTKTLRLEAIGTTIKVYYDGSVVNIGGSPTTTDSSVTSGGSMGIYLSSQAANTVASAAKGISLDAVRLYNT
jgi:hypothetical protein